MKVSNLWIQGFELYPVPLRARVGGFTTKMSFLRSSSYGTILFRIYGKNAAQTWFRELCSYFPEELWPSQGLGHLCAFWIMPKQPLATRRVDETSAENYPRVGICESLRQAPRKMVNSEPTGVPTHTHPRHNRYPAPQCGEDTRN